MEPAVGIEPTTDSLQNYCSTTELRWHDRRQKYDSNHPRAKEKIRHAREFHRQNHSRDNFLPRCPVRCRMAAKLKWNKYGRFTSRRQTGNTGIARGSRPARTRLVRAPARLGGCEPVGQLWHERPSWHVAKRHVHRGAHSCDHPGDLRLPSRPRPERPAHHRQGYACVVRPCAAHGARSARGE